MVVPQEAKTGHPGHTDSQAARPNTEPLTSIFTAFLSTTAKKWKQPGCPSRHDIQSVVRILSCKKIKLQTCRDMNRFGKYYIK